MVTARSAYGGGVQSLRVCGEAASTLWAAGLRAAVLLWVPRARPALVSRGAGSGATGSRSQSLRHLQRVRGGAVPHCVRHRARADAFRSAGDWRQIRPIDGQVVPVRGDYYLAGGRSNRDYPALVEAFRSLPARLVILCSQVNLEELGQVRIPIMSRSCATFLSRPSMNTFEVRKPASSPCGTIRVRPGRVWRSRSCETRNALWLPGPGD